MWPRPRPMTLSEFTQLKTVVLEEMADSNISFCPQGPPGIPGMIGRPGETSTATIAIDSREFVERHEITPV